MNIVILHRIPFAKIRYDRSIDHGRHTVRYLIPSAFDDLPSTVERRVLGVPSDDVLALAERHADWLGDADKLIARSEYDLLTAARLRAKFGIPGDLPADVLPLRDKWLMRVRAAEAGIPQPAFWSVEDFRREPPGDGTYLIKPRLEASSTGIETGDARHIAARLAAGVDPDAVFVEEFVPGEIWNIDGYVRRGEIGAVVSSVYVGDCLGFAHGSPLGCAQAPDPPQALSLLRETLRTLGQRDGCFNFECIRAADGRFLFLETGSRVGGAGVAETFELRTGVNLYQKDLEHQLHGHIEDTPRRPCSDYYGWFVFPGHHRTRPAVVRFDPARFGGLLRSFVRNDRPATRFGQISYAPAATPLSGVVQGSADEVRRTLREICFETEVVER
ncbi:acetyl-CoA carboxylase biotin carboxylase subunit family protein [Nonomuraea sp. NPDC049480]|uniref:acetyl-CoA carboxylase biotin carboxylase subunit family protein n=1 Tax=Nonomuraea sp. NPDC049480 TaxID=3364353 RepID=UPI0037B192B7